MEEVDAMMVSGQVASISILGSIMVQWSRDISGKGNSDQVLVRLATMLELVDNDTVRRLWLLLSSLLFILLTVHITAEILV